MASIGTPAEGVDYSSERRTRAGAVFSGLPACLAAILGALQVYADRNLALDPDVLGFQTLARHMTLSTVFGGVREPLWPVLFVIPVHLFGDNSALVIRFIGVLGFILMIVAFQMLSRQLFGPVWSTVAAALLAASPWLVFQSARGLREETSAGLILLFCCGLVRPRLTGRRFVLLFALAGLTGLLRWDSMVVMLPILGLALLLNRPPLAAWIAGPAVLLVMVGPLLLGNYLQHGDPLYHSNIHASFFRNVEFHDQPGFVTSAQIATNSYAGPLTTWTQYVFGLHTKVELMKRAVHAFNTIPFTVTTLAAFTPSPPYGGAIWLYRPRHLPGLVIQTLPTIGQVALWLIWVLSVAGGLLLIRTRAWPVPVILGETILVYSPIANLIDYRLVLAAFPLLFICVLAALRFGIQQLGQRRSQAARSSRLLRT